MASIFAGGPGLSARHKDKALSVYVPSKDLEHRLLTTVLNLLYNTMTTISKGAKYYVNPETFKSLAKYIAKYMKRNKIKQLQKCNERTKK